MDGTETTKKKYVPIPYFRKAKEGVPIKRAEQAQKVAEFLHENIWSLDKSTGNKDNLNKENINKNVKFNIKQFTMKELNAAIKKLKRDKAPGPDGLPTDFFKELDYLNKVYILSILNKWWTEEK